MEEPRGALFHKNLGWSVIVTGMSAAKRKRA